MKTIYVSVNLYILVDVDISMQNYTFTFNLNEILSNLNITLLIDDSPILVPYRCHCKFEILAILYLFFIILFSIRAFIN